MTASLIQQLEEKQKAVTQAQIRLLSEQDVSKKLALDGELRQALQELNQTRLKYVEWQQSEVKRVEQENQQF